jgi:hypothetical protein
MEKRKIFMWTAIVLGGIALTIVFAKTSKAANNSKLILDDSENHNGTSTNSNGKGICSKEGKVFTDHDKTWDYKVLNCRWHTKRKTNSSESWIDIHDNAVARERLENKYGKI